MKPNIGQGDRGTTSVFGGNKISKDDCQIDAYGNADELNSYIGFIRSINAHKELDRLLEKIQEDLFVLGSQISAISNPNLPQLTSDHVKFLEENIIKFENDLPELKHFILPSGSHLGSLFHVARSVCRRTERSLVSLSKEKEINRNIIPYVNRLSDLLFTLAKYVNKNEGVKEKEWSSRSR